MKILVTTPTGWIGRRVLRELLAPEFTVRVLTREPRQLPAEVHAGAEVIEGAGDDPVALARALDGVEALFWCLPAEPCKEPDIAAYHDRFARVAARAIREAQTPRVVSISALGHTSQAIEAVLDGAGAAIRHLRCGWLMENLAGHLPSVDRRGVFSLPLPGNARLPLVAATDVADVALRCLVRRNWRGTGIISLPSSRLACETVAEVLQQILRCPVRFQEVSVNQYVQALIASGASPAYARNCAELFVTLAREEIPAGLAAEAAPATSLAAWVADELRPQLLQPGPCACST